MKSLARNNPEAVKYTHKVYAVEMSEDEQARIKDIATARAKALEFSMREIIPVDTTENGRSKRVKASPDSLMNTIVET